MGKENKIHFSPLALILFWLAIEYVAFLLGYNFFLGNLLIDTGWTRWSHYTGVGGISLWILISCLFLYLALFRKWPYTVVFAIVIVGPILYSYTLPSEPVAEPGNGEWVARTAAWVSVLVLLSAVIKVLTRKK
jgi:hypothetical protein